MGLPFHGKALELQNKKISDIRLLQKHFPNKHLRRKNVDPELNIGQYEEHLFRPHEEALHLQSAHKDPPAEPSTPSMSHQGISPLSDRNKDLSEALTMVDKVVGTPLCDLKHKGREGTPKKTLKKTVATTGRSEHLNPAPHSMIIRVKKQPFVEPTKKKGKDMVKKENKERDKEEDM
ncbi:hypothetical protein QJS10_CPB12g00744 [Acorus calamus]|uniref:Uncharacterized protein n=1 Tax=Acorus calamus TaxID=4465 RepID=A0AAV9DKF3_ACOCL|nr:hypothetical protein QJS10_CPB12g00744 [Acorus calamus]